MNAIRTSRPTALAGAAAAAWLIQTAATAQTAVTTNLPTEGLVLHFGFDEAPVHSVVVDLSGRGNNGRLAGASWTASGRVGGGCLFGPAGQFIAVPASPSLQSKQATFMVWIRAVEGIAGRTLIDRHAGQGYALGLGDESKGSAARGRATATVAGHTCVGDTVIADGFWHHLAATYDGETVKLYVDGALQKQTAAWKGEIGAAGVELTIGLNRSNPKPEEKDVSYQGILDEVRVYDRALDAAAIQAIFAASKPKFTKNEVSRRIAELRELKERGLLLDDFFARKMKECEQ